MNMIVAVGRDGSIGRGGDLIWHIPEDLKHFKRVTMGHPVIMGRKTWESLPRRPLPGRKNIVMSRDADFIASGAEVACSVSEAIEKGGDNAPFIIGGEQIYRMFLPYTSTLYLTEIDADCGDADAFFPLPEAEEGWELTEESSLQTTSGGITYRFRVYENSIDK